MLRDLTAIVYGSASAIPDSANNDCWSLLLYVVGSDGYVPITLEEAFRTRDGTPTEQVRAHVDARLDLLLTVLQTNPTIAPGMLATMRRILEWPHP